ncbi:MFS transporter [Jatrophihabitans sp. YIM 134969]
MTASSVSTTDTPTPLRHRVRGNVLLLLCALYAILYFDRVNISTAGPNGLKADLGLSDFQFGLAISAFALPYALLQGFGGFLGDKGGARRTLVIVSVACGMLTVLTGLVNGLIALLVVRFLLGVAEGTAFPTATRAMSTWLPVDRRGFGQGIVHAASRGSNALAPVIVSALIAFEPLGWRGSFIVAGAAGMIWGIIWLVYFRDRPRDHPHVHDTELRELADTPDTSKATEKVPWRRLVPRILPVTLTDFCYGWMLWLYLTWMPSFFSDRFGLDLQKSALFTMATLIGGVAGDWLGGMLVDRLLVRTANIGRSRKTGLVIGLGGTAVFVTPVIFLSDAVAITVCLGIAFFFLELCNSPLWTIPMDIAPQHSGTASGLMNTGFGLAGIVAPPIVGALVDHATWGLVFGLSALIVLFGLVSVRWISLRPLHHPELDAGVPER